MNLVIGSGPAGLACVQGLLARGQAVTVIDAGVTLEVAQRNALARRRAEGSETTWQEIVNFHADTPLAGQGILLKTAYGSDYPYREAEERLGLVRGGTGLMASLAVGGLSTVWGAAALPYAQRDMVRWPVTQAEMAPHYEAVLKITGMTGAVDELARTFPLFATAPIPLRLSSQAARFLEALTSLKSGLDREGIAFGRSRLLVATGTDGRTCSTCGQCLYGCPDELIFNSGNRLAEMVVSGKVRYQTNLVVTRVREDAAGVIVEGVGRAAGEPVSLRADRVFLAAGVVPTAKIVLESLGVFEQTVQLLDSQYFLFPILVRRGDPNVTSEEVQTLSQLFLEILDGEISPYTIHLQVYTYSDIITRTLRQKFARLPWFRDLLVRQLEHRVLIVQGFFHSDHSGRIDLRLTRAGAKNQLSVQGVPSLEARILVAKIIAKLSRRLRPQGYHPIAQAAEIAEPGRGFHCGGSFPMSAHPGELQTDLWGRLAGHARIHLADASTFPSIPATTITLAAMANAHRIGAHAHE